MENSDEIGDCNLDELLNLLDDNDEPETNGKISDYIKNTELSVSNTAVPNTTSTKPRSKHKLNNSSLIEKPVNCDNNEQENIVDPLEKELLQMEQRMKKLKAEIMKKKNIKNDKPSFTKLSSVIDPNSQQSESVRYLNEEEKLNLISNLNAKKSEIHKGDTDSEDDEDNRNPFEAQMSSYGKEIKKRIAHAGKMEQNRSKQNGWNKHKSESLLSLGKKHKSVENEKELNTISDPFSGLRIMNPLISSADMKEMMQNRRMIPMSSISSQLRGGDIEGDWVTIGVIVSKSDTKTSQKGTQYSIWQMSDLKDCTKVISLFLFSGAYKNLWKSYVGSVVGILNPQIMKDSNKQTDGRNVLTMSVNTHEKILIMGTAKDLGWCKGRNKEYSTCKQFVNKNICEFCIFHIQKEYKKMSAKRSEIQSSFGRVDPRKAFQKKVLGKDQVFYGGQLFGFSGKESTSRKKLTPASKSKDLATLSSLSMKLKVETLKEKDKREAFKYMTDNQLATVAQVSKENEKLGEMLLAPTPGARNLLMHKSKRPSGFIEETSKASQITPLKSAKEFLKSTM
ncbi:Protein MCM10-like protein, partial [Armadillidium nasatum]